MSTFYDNWLGMWDQAEAERRSARKVIHEEEIEWVATRQDARAGLLIAPETGFKTWGSLSMLAEIPVGWHTGKHKHGEEAIHIVAGSGCSIIDGTRYDWQRGSTIIVPFGAEHQHFNLGQAPVRYFSVLSVHLEHFIGIHHTTQFEDCGETAAVPDAPASRDGFDSQGRRIALSFSEAPVHVSKDSDKIPVIEEGKPLVLGTVDGMQTVISGHKAQVVNFMRVGKDINGFQANEQEISSILTDNPHEYGGTHAHMEALLYILDGEGYSNVDGERVPWKAGSALHIQGPQTVHQHVNLSDVPSRMLRVAAGIRYFFEKTAKSEYPYLYLSYRQHTRERERERSL